MSECEEPHCTAEASKIWKGRKVCRDHFEQYQEEYNRIISDLRDIS